MSAENYARLVGVTKKAIYLWEAGVDQPLPEHVAKLASLRGIGKREAERRLTLLGVSMDGVQRTYPQTAAEFITSLVRSKKATTSAQINLAWTRRGRVGRADNDLFKMVKAGMLRRTKLQRGKGSTYSLPPARKVGRSKSGPRR